MGLRFDLRRLVSSVVGNTLVLVGIAVAGVVYAATGSSARDLLVTDLFINIVLVVGLHIFVGNTGVLSLGQLAFATIAAYTCALLTVPTSIKATLIPRAPWGLADVHMSPLIATAVAVAVAVGMAVVLSPVIARAPGLAATMITLALLFVIEQIAKVWTTVTNGGGRLSGVPGFSTSSNAWPIAGALLAVTVAIGFRWSTAGRFAVAGRDDELAAGAMGIDIRGPRALAFVVSAAVVGLGGVLQVRAVGSMGPEQFNFDVTILILAMLVVGGMHTVTGAMCGAVFITVGKEFARQLGDGAFGMPRMSGLPDLFLAGALLCVLVVTRRPQGLLGDVDAGRVVDRWIRRTDRVVDAADRDAPATGGELRAEGLGVRFGGFVAVDNVDIVVAPGEICGLIGPNGAGKTTVVNALTGMVEMTHGTVSIDGDALHGAPHVRARRGVARTFQNLRLFGALSVRDNVDVARLVAVRYRPHARHVGVGELLSIVGLDELADRRAATLDYGNQRRLEIARAAALAPEVLVLDEPTSGMGESESQQMVEQVRAVAARIGAGVLVIDHDLAFITAVCDRIVVLDQGRLLAEGSPAAIVANPDVIEAYIGTSPGASGA